MMKIVTSIGLMVLMALLMCACSSSDSSISSDSSTPTVSLQGAVVDGYVKNATVTLYSADDLGAPTAIASGSTDADGNFVLNLPQSQLPDRMALLSRGGTIIDTGLPAPTMAMVALQAQDGYFITPITDSIVWQGLQQGGSFNDAVSNLAGDLGLTQDELYGNPLAANAPQTLQTARHRALASGEQSILLPDGDYKLCIVALDKSNLVDSILDNEGIDGLLRRYQYSGTLSITNGSISGTLDDSGETVSGEVQGANMVLSVNYTGGVTRLSATAGLFGSLSGSYINYDTGNSPALSSGVFVGSLIPASGVDVPNFKQAAADVFGGNRNALFRDLYGDRDLAWAAINNITIDTVNNTVRSDDFTVHLNAASGATDTITFVDGRLVLDVDGNPTGLVVLRYQDSTGDYAYLVQALGNRRGIYVAGDGSPPDSGNYAIGESYFSRRDLLGGNVLTKNTGQSLDLAVTNISLDMLGQPRNPNDFILAPAMTIDVPTLTESAGASGDAKNNGVQAFSGNMLGLKDSSSGADGSLLDDPNDSLVLTEVRSTGAFQGDIAEGGTLVVGDGQGGSLSVDAADWPVPVVGMLAPSGTSSTSTANGDIKMDFIARPLYTLDTTVGQAPYPLGDITNYQLVIKGKIQFNDSSATLDYQDSAGETGTLNLSVGNQSGIYHFEGDMGPEYLDIFWARGASRGVFVASDQNGGTGTIYEIGEVFMTY